MNRERVKVYTYKRVSTTMQIDGYSLDAQKSRIKAFADYNDYEIVREYEDAGKSGKSIEGRIQFNQMMDDIKSGKDGVSFVLVFKLSRFGRNAADVLSTLQVMQDFGVNLICVEDGIDSSKDAGKLMISVLSAVAEIERENIRVQTMEGRIQKAREGKWNGGFAPYGYQLVDGELQINEEEAAAIRVIFDRYVNTDIGSNGIAKYLENHGIRKIQRQNGKNPLFDAHLIRLILKNPVYCGKIAYGRRRTEKVHGTRNDYHLVEQDNYLLVDGLHEAIISEEVWQAAQVKLLAQAKKYEHVNKGKDTRTHLLSGIVKCPICGAGMYGNKCIKHKKDGTKYKDFYYYGCKHRTMTRGHKCEYRKQIREELLDDAVTEVIVALVSKPKFASMMQEKINMKVDTSMLDQEIANHEKQLRQFYSIKSKLMEEIDSLDPDDRHYFKRKADLDDRLYRMYDKIEDEESQMIEARAKRQAIEAEKLTGDNIYKVLMCFDKLYSAMNDVERRRVMEALISEIQIHEDRQPNGQWLKSIRFRLPIIEEDMNLSLDNNEHVETLWDGTPSVYKDYEKTKANVWSLKPYIDAHAGEKILTHIDAVPDNFLFVQKNGKEEIRLIDWEYAGMQDPHVDIAMFCIYSLYNKRQVDRLIAAYFTDGCDDATRIKIYCYIAACGLLWSNWCEYKRNLGVEFGEYSLRQYRYAKDYYRIVQDELKKSGESGAQKNA